MTTNAADSNVLLITVDSLRVDAISPYEEERETPALNSLAQSATVFENAFATGNWTPFSFPAIMAGRHVFTNDTQVGVENLTTIGSVLTAADISTAGFNAANGFLTEHWGYNEGFDEFDSFVASVGSSVYSRYLARHPTVEAWMQLAATPFRRLRSLVTGGYDDRPFLDTSRMFDVESAAKSFLATHESPFFLWVHYMDTHTPYVPAPRYIRATSDSYIGTHRMLHAHTRTGLGLEVGEHTLAELRSLYHAAAAQVDASIGRLLSALKEDGHREDTTVIVAGDHGEEFQEHGHLAHYPKLYDELIHVPLLVSRPSQTQTRIETQVGLNAIPATIAESFGVSPPVEWAPALPQGEPTNSTDPVVSVAVRGKEVTAQPIPRSLDHGDLLVSVRDSQWTYILNTETGEEELYHRASDPQQQDNRTSEPLSVAETTILAEFGDIARNHATTLRAQKRTTSASDVDSELGTRLEALGYR
jgi:arylsulfatase A-like enzyme